MTDTFLHGIEVLDIDDGARVIQTASTSVIGIVGTAPNADPTVFPLNTPVLIAGSRALAGKLIGSGTLPDNGTLPDAVNHILDVTGAVIVVVRVDKGVSDAATLANVLGGVDSNGNYTGIQAFLAAEPVLGFKPRILIAPGFTHQRVANGVATLTISAQGSGYTDGTYNLTVSGGGGTGAAATAVVSGGKATSVSITSAGSGYTSTPTFALPAGAGAGTGATFTATVGTTANAVVSAMVGIAERLRAVIIADGPSTTDADAIAYAGDFGSKRVFLVDPQVLTTDSTGATVPAFVSAYTAGVIARTDNDNGFWWSPSNQTITGVTGVARAIDFLMGDPNSRANLLNSKNVATVIRQNGFRLWGNRTLSSDPKWAFLCVVRTADIINDSLQAAHLWAVDRGITKNYVDEVVEGVNAYLRHLKAIGAILGGKCWADPGLNTPDQIANGHVYFDFDFTAVYPAEHITFRSHLVNDYISEIF